MAIMATGGYGRAELCPHSDIISLVYGSQSSGKVRDFQVDHPARALSIVGFEVQVGHASRTIKESIAEARSDIQTKTAFFSPDIFVGMLN